MGVLGIGAERIGVEARGVDVHADAGADDIGKDQPDRERDRGHDLEIDQRLAADPPHFLEIASAGDSVNHDAKDDRRHDHRDQLEKGVAEELEADGEFGREHAERDAENEARDHLREQGFVERRPGRGGDGCGGHGQGVLKGSREAEPEIPVVANLTCKTVAKRVPWSWIASLRSR